MIVVILFVIVVIVCLIAFLFNYIAGHGAYVEGKTRKKGTVYIIVTVLLLLLTGYGIVGTFMPEEEAPAAEPENQETLIDAGDNTEALGDS
jgi:NADH:ubiquinone oxidoreductase subunit 6 (subunit J)